MILYVGSSKSDARSLSDPTPRTKKEAWIDEPLSNGKKLYVGKKDDWLEELDRFK